MADIRPTASSSSLVPQARTTPAQSEAAKSAQRAFFQAALDGVAAVATAQPKIAPAIAVQPTRSDSTSPNRLLRPGSLLDIKV